MRDQATAWNSGDPQAWLSFYSSDAILWSVTLRPGKDITNEFVDAYFAADSVQTVGDCREHDGESILCWVEWTTAFHEAGGVSAADDHRFVFDGRNLIRGILTTDARVTFERFRAFEGAFWEWIEQAHPEVHRQIAGLTIQYLPTFPNPEAMDIVLGYVDEFVEQSPDYPDSE